MFVYELSGCGFESRSCDMSSSFSIYVFKCDLLIVHIVSANTVSCCPQSAVGVVSHLLFKDFLLSQATMSWDAFCSFDSFFLIGLWFWHILSYIWCWVDQSRKAELIIFTIASTIQRRIQNQVRHVTRSFFKKKNLQWLAIFVKSYIADVWLGFECASATIVLEKLWIETVI